MKEHEQKKISVEARTALARQAEEVAFLRVQLQAKSGVLDFMVAKAIQEAGGSVQFDRVCMDCWSVHRAISSHCPGCEKV